MIDGHANLSACFERAGARACGRARRARWRDGPSVEHARARACGRALAAQRAPLRMPRREAEGSREACCAARAGDLEPLALHDTVFRPTGRPARAFVSRDAGLPGQATADDGTGDPAALGACATLRVAASRSLRVARASRRGPADAMVSGQRTRSSDAAPPQLGHLMLMIRDVARRPPGHSTADPPDPPRGPPRRPRPVPRPGER